MLTEIKNGYVHIPKRILKISRQLTEKKTNDQCFSLEGNWYIFADGAINEGKDYISIVPCLPTGSWDRIFDIQKPTSARNLFIEEDAIQTLAKKHPEWDRKTLAMVVKHSGEIVLYPFERN